jgi:hypothetical protein
MFRFLFGTRKPDTRSALSDPQRRLVEKKFDLLQRASDDFTQDKLLHLQGEDVNLWTGACTGELRRKITSVAASHAEISLIDFPQLRCVSLQCVPLTHA